MLTKRDSKRCVGFRGVLCVENVDHHIAFTVQSHFSVALTNYSCFRTAVYMSKIRVKDSG